MIDFQQKRKINRVIYSKISFIILLVLVIFLGRSTWDIYKKSKLSFDNYVETKKDYENLKARKDMLEAETNRLKTDIGIEEEIRSKFNVAKPGETVVIVIDSSSSTSTDKNSFQKSFWNLWGIIR
ncbi:MAG: septum formation initiator family protein [Candidatus Paceibacterota bacterium]|jgi:cell division protein FtsB